MKEVKQLENICHQVFRQMTMESNPYFYPRIQNDSGYQGSMDMVVRYAITNSISIGASVGQLESSYAE